VFSECRDGGGRERYPASAPFGLGLLHHVQLPVHNKTDDQERPLYYLVICPVSEACYANSHRLNHFDDHVSCVDCELVAAQSMEDGVDVDTALLAFRAWTRQ
jgi:hypothetical protein